MATTALPSGDMPQFSKADQIKQLNDIDKVSFRPYPPSFILHPPSSITDFPSSPMLTLSQKLTQLIKSAGDAVKTLTSIQTQSPSLRQLAYQHAADLYFQKLHEIDTASKAQAKALQKAKIIPRDVAIPSSTTSKERSEALDIGWLNTRSNKVGRDLEVELWEKARVFLEGKQGENEERAFNENDRENMEALREAHSV